MDQIRMESPDQHKQLEVIFEIGINSLCCLCFGHDEDELYSLDSLLDTRTIFKVLKEFFEFEIDKLIDIKSCGICEVCLNGLQEAVKLNNNVKNSKNILEMYKEAKQAEVFITPENDFFPETEIKMETESHLETIEEDVFVYSYLNDEPENVKPQAFEVVEELIQECKDCFDIFASRKTLAIHRKKFHNTDYIYQCNTCVCNFKTIEDLQVHNETNHSSNIIHICTICAFEFYSKQALESHMISHENPEKRSAAPPCCCEVCGKFFATQLRLDLHKRVHSGFRPEICNICGKSFTQPGGLSAHRKTHMVDAKQYCCDVCGKRFLRKEDLKHHFRLHTGERPHRCPFCPKTFTKSSNMKSHIYSHTGEKKFSCPICKARMSTSSQRKVHIEKHNKTIQIYCEVCKKGFSHISNLRKHQQIHQGIKYQCDLCDKSFARMEGMKNHRRVHTNSNPYSCKECDGTFRTLEILKNHLKVHQENYKSRKSRSVGIKEQKKMINVVYDYTEVAESVQQIIQQEQCSD